MRDFGSITRIVIKVGTNVMAPGGIPDEQRIVSLAADIACVKDRGIRPILVSSGAIGFGARVLGVNARPRRVEMRQACAAVGQPILMKHWQDALGQSGVVSAQILLGRESFNDRRAYLNLRNSVERLLALDAVPIFNENDSVFTSEIGDVFGDNDSLSAHVAAKLNAALLILLTDVDALYSKDPRQHPDAHPLHRVEKITDEIRAAAGEAGSEHATGGMVTKLQAAEIASRAGCPTVLANGGVPGNLSRILSGEYVGTMFTAGSKINARSRWILSAAPKGTIHVDPGTEAALHQRKSLLPKGVTGVEGTFSVGDVVRIGSEYQGITSMSNQEILLTMGHHSRNVRDIIGPRRREEVARAEDIAVLVSPREPGESPMDSSS